MNYSFGALGLSDLSWSGPDPFASGSGRNLSAINQGTVITVDPDAHWQPLVLLDTDGPVLDDDSDQESVGSQTYNGTTFADATSIRGEYSYVLHPAGATDSSTDITIYVLQFDSDITAIASSTRLVLGQSPVSRPGGGPHARPVVAAGGALLPGFGAGPAVWAPARPLLRPGDCRRDLRHAA